MGAIILAMSAPIILINNNNNKPRDTSYKMGSGLLNRLN